MRYEERDYIFLKDEQYRGYTVNYYYTETSVLFQFLVWIPLDNNKKYVDRSFEDVQDFARKEIDRVIRFRDGQ